MKITFFSTVGGLKLIGQTQTEYGPRDCMVLDIPKESLNAMAIAAIREVNMGASPELLALCKEVTEFSQAHA